MARADQILNEMVSRIRDAMHPKRIVLFGSRARGEARLDSDFDLLIINESDKPRCQRSARLYGILADLPAEVEVLVYTPQEVQEWSSVPQAFITTALREGKVLYEGEGRTDSQLASKSRKRRAGAKRFADRRSL